MVPMRALAPLRTVLRAASHHRASASTPEAPSPLTHLDGSNRARMVDVSGKPTTSRTARASARVHLGVEAYRSVAASLSVSPTTSSLSPSPSRAAPGASTKGDVLTVAQLAGIQAAKQTASLIPLCHPLPLAHVAVSARLVAPDAVHIDAVAATDAQTGVEMEAMTAAAVAALTVYDMVKGVSKGVSVTHVRLEEKRGGKSGDYVRDDAE